jgi:hypothetical protein
MKKKEEELRNIFKNIPNNINEFIFNNNNINIQK